MSKKQQIIDFIKSCNKGEAINQTMIANRTGISKPTVGKYLPLIKLEGSLNDYATFQRIGNAVIIVRT